LLDSVTNPIESHVDCFGSALFDSFIGKSCSAGVVCLKRGIRLWMPHFNESGARRRTASRALWNKAPNSASVADAMTLAMMALMVWMAPLYGAG
jgi:hypothetical protein